MVHVKTQRRKENHLGAPTSKARLLKLLRHRHDYEDWEWYWYTNATRKQFEHVEGSRLYVAIRRGQMSWWVGYFEIVGSIERIPVAPAEHQVDPNNPYTASDVVYGIPFDITSFHFFLPVKVPVGFWLRAPTYKTPLKGNDE